jgi:hypothetical protein
VYDRGIETLESEMTDRTEAAKFIAWNDGFVAAREGVALNSRDVDFVAGYRYYQHMQEGA